MSMPHPAISPRELGRATAAAQRLVTESHGTNLDAIYEALDRSLLTRAGMPRPGVLDRLRPIALGGIDVDSFATLTGPQLAARILCQADPAIHSTLAAAPADDIERLVNVIATCLFQQVNRDVLAVASTLTALLAARGLEPFCASMGLGPRTERVAS